MSSQKALFLYHEIYFVAIGLWLYKPVRFSEAHHLRQCIFTVCVCVSSCAPFDSSVVLYIAMIAGLKLLELSLLNSLCFLISSLAHWRPVSLFRKTAVHPKTSVHKYHSLVYCCANDVQVNSCCLSSHLCSTVNIYHCKSDSFACRVSQHLGCYTTPRPSLSASPCPFFFRALHSDRSRTAAVGWSRLQRDWWEQKKESTSI